MDVSGDFASRWWKSFWWARGAIAAMTLLTLVTGFTDFSRLQFLRAFQLLIWHWNLVAGWIGRVIGDIFDVPHLEPEVVNAILFSLSFCAPAAVALWWASEADEWAYESWLSLSIISKSGYVLRQLPKLAIILFFFAILLPYYLFVSNPLFINFRFIPDFVPKPFVVFILYFFMLVMIGIGVSKIPGFLHGLFSLLVFLVTIEVLYLINAGYLSDWVNTQYCIVIEPRPDDCAA